MTIKKPAEVIAYIVGAVLLLVGFISMYISRIFYLIKIPEVENTRYGAKGEVFTKMFGPETGGEQAKEVINISSQLDIGTFLLGFAIFIVGLFIIFYGYHYLKPKIYKIPE